MCRITKLLSYLFLTGAGITLNTANAETSAVIAGQLAFQMKMVQSGCSVNFSTALRQDATFQLSHCPVTPYKVEVVSDSDSQRIWQLNSQKSTDVVARYTVVHRSAVPAEERLMPVSGILITYF